MTGRSPLCGWNADLGLRPWEMPTGSSSGWVGCLNAARDSRRVGLPAFGLHRETTAGRRCWKAHVVRLCGSLIAETKV